MAALNPLAAVFGPPEEDTQLLPPRLTIRVGVAGHLNLQQQEARIEKVTRDVLARVVEGCLGLQEEYQACFRKTSADPEKPCFRLITSLAAGADQLAARIASDLGYSLQVVLPAAREEFRRDIARNTPPDSPVNPVQEFDKLLAKKEIVFELDGNLDATGLGAKTKRNPAYAAAARVVLAHSDLLIVILSQTAKGQAGATLWLARRAIREETPMILIPIEEPERAEIHWYHGGKPVRRYLYPEQPADDAGCVMEALLRLLLVLPKAQRPLVDGGRFQVIKGVLRRLLRLESAHGPLPDSGRFERQYRGRLKLDKNRSYWDERWGATESSECPPHGAEASKRQIDKNCKEFAVWSDHRASAYGEMVRGAFASSAVLGAMAVSFALLNVLFAGLSVFAKTVELFLLAIVLTMYCRARHYGWKERWLNYRRLERHLNAAAWLALVGRTIRLHVPAHGSAFHDRAAWENWYTRAVLRQASLPEVRVGPEYLNAVRDLLLEGLVRDQITYYQREIEEHTYTEQRLERLGRRFLTWAFLGTLGYLGFHKMHDWHWLPAIPGYVWLRSVVFGALNAAGVTRPGYELAEAARRLAIVLGAGLPAWAGALAAIRSQGEHSQIALRYGGQIVALTRIEHKFNLLSDDPGSISPLRLAPLAWNSTDLTRLALGTTNALTDEVHYWHSMLFTKEIEPT